LAKEFRSKIFSVENSGAYVQVFQRPGERVLIETNLFEGNKSILEQKHQLKALSDAITLASDWTAEGQD
jgi:hypothetical protein